MIEELGGGVGWTAALGHQVLLRPRQPLRRAAHFDAVAQTEVCTCKCEHNSQAYVCTREKRREEKKK